MDGDFIFVGGDVSLDLVNTLLHRDAPGGPDELLSSGAAARRWFVRAGVLSDEDATSLDENAALASAKHLRSALDLVYRPIARRSPNEDAARGLDVLNDVLGRALERVRVSRVGGAFVRTSTLERPGRSDPGVHVARAAAELLHRLDERRLKECENPGCDALFYDESRNNSRRWCAMTSCGNLHKQARFRRNRRPRA